MPNESDLKTLLEQNELLRAKVTRQSQAISSVLGKIFRRKPTQIVESVTLRLAQIKDAPTFPFADNLTIRDPPEDVQDCHFLIRGLRETITLKDREILGLRLTHAEIEKKIGVEAPIYYK